MQASRFHEHPPTVGRFPNSFGLGSLTQLVSMKPSARPPPSSARLTASAHHTMLSSSPSGDATHA